MSRRALALVAALLLAACTNDARRPSPTEPPARGGTLRLVTPRVDVLPPSVTQLPPNPATLDPTLEYESFAWEVLRCCLVRTLMSLPGTPANEAGGVALPDLAAEHPEVSGDGLTWTFRLREGVRYAAPLEDVEVTSGDVARALERLARLGAAGYGYYYSIIEGFDAAATGEAESITGVETPDDHTLVVRLTRPSSDLPHLFSLAATAPIPPNASRPEDEFGAAGPEPGYGTSLVATGPYMFEGTEGVDLSAPPAERGPVSGLRPGRGFTLVRNPSWQSSTDPLRPALADRIELAVVEDQAAAFDRVEDGDADLVVATGLAPQAPEDLIARYQADPAIGRVEIQPREFVFSVAMNVALPPFDDVNVRRAVNLVVDKRAIIDRWGGHLTARVGTHLAGDASEGNLLAAYDPYDTPDKAGSVDAAREHMSQSRYDRDGDGRCDVAACRDLDVPEQRLTGRPEIGSIVRENLASIGIEIADVTVEHPDAFNRRLGPPARIPMAIAFGWARDYPSASTYFTPLFLSPSLGGIATSLVGATPAELEEWGYPTREVPSVDDRIDQCFRVAPDEAVACWATLDQYLMEEVVPAAPFAVDHHVQLIPKRVVAYSYSHMSTLPALDRIAVDEGQR